MKIRKSGGYDSFVCLAGDCPHTCCAGWKIQIDEEALERYASWRGDFGCEVRNSVDWMEECFIQNDKGCLNLREDGLCRIQGLQGEEALCDTCRLFPRHVEEYPGIREYSLSLSCPAVVRGLLENTQIKPDTEKETDEEDDLFYEDFDPELFTRLVRQREELRLMADRASDWESCRDAALQWAGKDKKNREETAPFWIKDRRRTWLFLQGLFPVDREWQEKLKLFIRQMDLPEMRDERKSRKLFEEFLESMKKTPVPGGSLDHLLIAIYWSLLSVYLPGAAYDGEEGEKILLALFFADWVRESAFMEWLRQGKRLTVEDVVCLAAMFDRQVEHDDDNLLTIEEWLAKG